MATAFAVRSHFPYKAPVHGTTAREDDSKHACEAKTAGRERDQKGPWSVHGVPTLSGHHILRWQIFKCVEDKAGDFYFMCIFNLNDGRGAFDGGPCVFDGFTQREIVIYDENCIFGWNVYDDVARHFFSFYNIRTHTYIS